MKNLLLALAIGLTAMGCNRYGQEEEKKNPKLETYVGYVEYSHCADIDFLIQLEKDGKYVTSVYATNLQGEYKKHRTKVEVTFETIKEVQVLCPGFDGYTRVVKITNIKKIE